MAKVYTAQEMRELAGKIWDYETMPKGLELCDNELGQVDCEATHDLIGMLRQAAELMEREEKKPKKYQYQYAARYFYPSGVIATDHIFDNPTDAIHFSGSREGAKKTICRREVGEWEEVKDAD